MAGLIRRESLEIWSVWHRFGGSERGLSVDEILAMPGWLRQDFDTIHSRLGKERRRRRALEKAQRGNNPTRT